MTKRYYSIRFERTDGLHHVGEQILNADNPLRIGQTESCDIRLDNRSQYEDAVLAVIEKQTNNQDWKLIRLSPYKEHEIRVNGTPVDYVHFLNDGDHITFEGQRQELSFNIREDSHYNSNAITKVPAGQNFRILLISLLVFALGIGTVALHKEYTRPITPKMIGRAKASVFQIRVDSVQLLSIHGIDTVRLQSCPMNVTGTAFLTSDSLLVTARHCIEPWLNICDTVHLDTTSLTLHSHVKWALQAVTHNIVNEDDPTRWEMVSHCSVWQMTSEPKRLFSVKSNQFFMDNSRDMTLDYGDFNHKYFWRSISARPPRVDMMLGDIAYFPVNPSLLHHHKGSIHLASKKVMKKVAKNDNNQIVILGFPKVVIGAQEMESTESVLKKTVRLNSEDYPEFVLSHDGNLGPGYSGGPVLIKQGFKWYVIGAISVTDKYERNRFYSVPVTEVERIKSKQKQH